MVKVRIHEIAKELGIKSKEVVEKAEEIGLKVKTASSAVGEEDAEQLMNYILTGNKPVSKKETKEPKKEVKTVSKEQKTKKAPKKESVKKEETKIKKEEIKKVKTHEKKPKKEKPKYDEVKIEEKEIKKESLAQASLKKRRGLVIVKKKRPKIQPEAPKAQPLADQPPKKKKKVKKAAAPKKEVVEKIDIMAAIEMKETEIESEEQMIVLPDLSMNDVKKAELRDKKAPDPDKVRIAKKSTFLNQGIKRKKPKKRKKRVEEKTEQVKAVEIPEEIRVYEFAEKLGKTPSDIIKALFTLGVMVTKNDFLDKDAIEILADEFDVEVTTVNPLEEFDYEKDYVAGEEENMKEKPPVITIMGHVDHGKTSLLDKIRESKVALKEHGGITQHVGAYMVEKNDKKITFIDTPGHEAFTQMRSRGAQATDIVVIVVAADDGVKPQTKEAIDHAKAANVPFVVAVNKIDKPDANADLVKSQLAELGITPVDWGGEYEFIEVSAKTGKGIDELLEVLLLQAEILELKANPDADAKAVVVESSLEKGRGAVATIIVQNGTLRVGNTIVSGVAYGKVRALLDEDGNNIEAIHPGEPGVVVGLSEVPKAGETLVRVKDDKTAREYADKRAEYVRQKELSRSTKVTIEELSSKIAEGRLKSLPLIIKADVGGSLEAIRGSLDKLKNEEVKVNIIHADVGGITESDVTLAEASENCVVLGFQVRPTGSVKERAKKAGVEIKTYNVIYDLIDDVKGLLGGLLSPVTREEQLGQAEVREVFTVPKIGAVAGCIVSDGTINRGVKVRVIRDGVIIYEGKISSLKRFKDDVREVAKGYECGIGIEGYNDIKVGDYLESFKEVEEKAVF